MPEDNMNMQDVLRILDGWGKIITGVRMMANEFSSPDGDNEFVENLLESFMTDLFQKDDQQVESRIRIRPELGIGLELSMRLRIITNDKEDER